MSNRVFGWNYPAGAEHDPRAPWNEPEEAEYVRLDRELARMAASLSRLRRHKVSIETDGAVDEPATVIIRVDGVDWSRLEEELENTLKDIVSAMEARRGVK